MVNEDKELQRAKNYAFRLLKIRQRSIREIRERLTRKKYTPPVIDKVISSLKGLGYLDDKIFASAWIRARLKRPYGFRRIFLELKNKGINKELIEQSFKELKQGYSENIVVKELISKRLKLYKDLNPAALKRRLFAYLVRRGFNSETIKEEINNCL
jgi:regulatory protein